MVPSLATFFSVPLSLSILIHAIWASPLKPQRFSADTPLPLVIWHGLGDDFGRDGLKQVAQLAETTNPGTYTHLIRLANDPSGDRDATFLGNVTAQVEQVCEQLSSEPILSTAPAINALGFSQGGQFLRAYVERCNNPPVNNLVTYGSQHNGISKFQPCETTGDWVCRATEALLRFGTWSNFAQSRVVPAQYFRDPEEIDSYLENSNFLADINNERDEKNEGYKKNLMQLNRFVMVMFDTDDVVVPKESAFFAEVNLTNSEVTELRDRKIYQEDWLGLKDLDEKGRLDFLTVPGHHMQLQDANLRDVFTKYFGPVNVGSGYGQNTHGHGSDRNDDSLFIVQTAD